MLSYSLPKTYCLNNFITIDRNIFLFLTDIFPNVIPMKFCDDFSDWIIIFIHKIEVLSNDIISVEFSTTNSDYCKMLSHT